MSSTPLSERIRNLTGWFDPEFAPEAQIVNGLANEVRNLENTVCLPPPQIIRTIEELEAIDPNTVLTAFRDDGVDVIFRAWDVWQNDDTAHFPAVVICGGEQLFSARNALQKETNND